MDPIALVLAGLLVTEHRTALAVSDKAPSWAIAVGVSSASLGREEALLVTSSVVALKPGEQGLITFWETETSIYRCVDTIGSDYDIRMGPCFAPR